MRKFLLPLILLLFCGVAAFIVIRVIRGRRPAPTQVGWRAHVSTIAGDGSPVFRDAIQPAQAAFADPFGVVIAVDGTVYVSDAGDSNRIRKLALDGSVSTFAGSSEGYADGPGAAAKFNSPSGLAIDAGGNLYVADSGNNRIRKLTPQGIVSTVAGEGSAGYRDGPASQAQFGAPLAVAVDTQGNLFVADTYNDRIRLITLAGEVSTIAGTGLGYADGSAETARFDTPSGIAAAPDGSLIVADTGNGRLRRISADRKTVETIPVVFASGVARAELGRPIGVAVTYDGFIYATELDRSRVLEIAPGGATSVVAGDGPGFRDGADAPRFNQLAGVAIYQYGKRRGDLLVADGGNYLVRRLAQTNGAANEVAVTVAEPVPRLTNVTLDTPHLQWPVDPQESAHEVVATLGEVRGSFDSSDSRDHLHSGLDVFAAYGETVRAVRSEKIVSPLCNWGFGSLNEGLRAGVISYIHQQIGRDVTGKPFADARFIQVKGDDGKLARIRIRRGTRFKVGDALGTVNRMYHVHLNVGPPGAEVNPLSLAPLGFSDRTAPQIERDGIQLFDESGARLQEKKDERLLVHGRLRIVVDAFDRADMNSSRRRLGLYRLGYQLLNKDRSPAPGFAEPRITIVFDRLTFDPEAPKITYAEDSGITVYGSATTRFLYEVTNTVRDGLSKRGLWDSSSLQPGDYILRIIAADYSGNEAIEGRDLPVTVR